MKLPILFLLVVTVCRSAAPTPATGEIHLGLSPFMDTAQRRSVGAALPALILEPANLPAGTRVIIWDAWQLVRVADFTIPTREFDTKRARAIKLQPALVRVGQWLNAPAPDIAGVAAGSSAVRVPEWLFEASATPTNGSRAFTILGSPFYHSPSEPAFDMATDARYPSDGHLSLGLRDSVFGLAEKSGRLAHATVQWVYPGQSVWANELHRHSVTRFWTLFVQGQGGTLAGFGADLRAALSRALQPGQSAVLRVQPDPADEKALMRSAHPRSLPAWLEQIPSSPAPAPAPAPVAPPTPAPVVETPAPVVVTPVIEPTPVVVEIAAPAPAPVPPVVVAPVPMPAGFDTTKTGLGIAWSAPGVDLDLHVKLFPGAEEIFYKRDRTREGFLYKDERKANAGRFYEFVEFTGTGPVDLSRASVWVHYYDGRARDVSGQVVLFDRGAVRVGTFTLRAQKGNGGDSGAHRATSPHWVEIRLADLVAPSAPLAAAKPGQK